jgi:Dyp-type peroxidase family
MSPATDRDAGRRLVEHVEAARPDLVLLATTVSIAVRIEPALLRRCRLQLEPELPVDAEADIWFSPLVGSFSPRAMVLQPDVAAVLRERLAADPQRCRAARRIIAELHAEAAPTIRLEEEVLYRALTGDGAEQIEPLLERALNTMNEDDKRSEAIARWATEALPAMPARARDADSAQKLEQGAERRLGRERPVEVGLRLLPQGVAVSHPPAEASHVVELPGTEPVRLLVKAAGTDTRPLAVPVEREAIRNYQVAHGAAGLDIETTDGRVLELRPREQAEPSTGKDGPPIDLRDLQGDILRAYGNDYDHTSYAFVSIDCPPEQAQAWLGGLLYAVTRAAPWTSGVKPLTTLNVAVTAAGLRALGVSEEAIGSFSGEFQQGMADRARRLGDTGPSDPGGWERGLGTGEAHVLLTINAQEREDHERALGKMREAMEAAGGIRVVFQQDSALLPAAREHFGFADGFSQPAIEGASDDKAPGGGVPESGGRWRALAPGEFVLGYADEDTRKDPRRRLPNAPVEPLGRSGTYMVWRKLYQDVAVWRRVLRHAARYYDADGDEHKLAAKIVGRWPDGTPLVTHPDKPEPNFNPAARDANDFRYADDLDGRRCPLGAHIRRANPRDALGFEGALTYRHRMIRRGMPYGPPLPEGVTRDDGIDRGLVFVSFQASISRQFEAVQLQWLNDGNIFGLGHDKDFLLGADPGAGGGKMTIQGDPPFFLSPQDSFVRTRGGEYLFVPGMSALAAIADGTAG